MRKRSNRNQSETMFATAETLAGLLECGRGTADKIGKEAGARVQYGKCVRYNVEKVRDYLNSLTERGD